MKIMSRITHDNLCNETLVANGEFSFFVQPGSSIAIAISARPGSKEAHYIVDLIWDEVLMISALAKSKAEQIYHQGESIAFGGDK